MFSKVFKFGQAVKTSRSLPRIMLLTSSWVDFFFSSLNVTQKGVKAFNVSLTPPWRRMCWLPLHVNVGAARCANSMSLKAR